jgi:Ca-activated chloride channel family protein
MKFINPQILYLLWAIIPIVMLMVFGIRQRKKILGLFADPRVYQAILPGFHSNARWIKTALIAMALVLSIFALAGPQAGFRWEETRQKGVDIMIALDCSQSMLAQDITPNRLEQAKREIIDLTRLMKSDRAGLVAFAGQAILQCPLTLDHDAFNIFLRVLNPDYLPVGGTNLTAAIETCYNGFEKDSDTEKAIFLITDGENTTGDAEEIVKKMGEEGIKIFCIGVGDPGGAPIPDPAGGFKKGASGNIILSRVDEKGLEKIASITNGRYIRAMAGDMDLDKIYSQDILKGMERKTLTQGKKKVWEHRFQWFLLPCILLLLLELILPVRKKSAMIKKGAMIKKDATIKKDEVIKKGATMGIVLLALALGAGISPNPVTAKMFSSHVKKGIEAYEASSFEQAKTHFIDAQLESPDDLRLYYNIGAAAYMNKDYEQAEKNFAQAVKSQDPDLGHSAMYNLANTKYRLGNLSQAIEGYESLLESFPEDQEAKENLEFVKLKQEEKKQQDQKDKDQKDKESQQDKESKDSQKNQDQKDQDQKNPGDSQQKDPDQKKQNSQEPSPDKGEKPEQGKNESGSDKAGENQGEKDQGEKDQEKKDQTGQAQAMDQAKNQEEGGDNAESKLMENRLNRLEDKPGMGMMPVIREQYIEKDW